MRIGGSEWLIILVVVLLLFGATRLPKLARSLGSSAKEFRKGLEEGAKGDEASAESGTVEADTVAQEPEPRSEAP